MNNMNDRCADDTFSDDERDASFYALYLSKLVATLQSEDVIALKIDSKSMRALLSVENATGDFVSALLQCSRLAHVHFDLQTSDIPIYYEEDVSCHLSQVGDALGTLASLVEVSIEGDGPHLVNAASTVVTRVRQVTRVKFDFDARHGSAVQGLCGALQGHSCLEGLRSCYLSDGEDVDALCQALPALPRLEEVELRSRLNLVFLPSTRMSAISIECLSRVTKLESLTLNGFWITGANTGAALSRLLLDGSSLKHLCLFACHLEEDCRALVESLGTNTSLKSLTIDARSLARSPVVPRGLCLGLPRGLYANSTLEELVIKLPLGELADANQMRHLVQAVAHSKLRRLELPACRWAPEVGQSVRGCLASASALRHLRLDFSWGDIPSSWPVVAPFLTTMQLVSLCLRGVGDNCLVASASCFSCSPEHLEVQGCSRRTSTLTAEGLADFVAALPDDSSLRRFTPNLATSVDDRAASARLVDAVADNYSLHALEVQLAEQQQYELDCYLELNRAQRGTAQPFHVLTRVMRHPDLQDGCLYLYLRSHPSFVSHNN